MYHRQGHHTYHRQGIKCTTGQDIIRDEDSKGKAARTSYVPQARSVNVPQARRTSNKMRTPLARISYKLARTLNVPPARTSQAKHIR